MTNHTASDRTLIEQMLRLVFLYRRRRIHVTQWDVTNIDTTDIVKLYQAQRERAHECKRLGVGVFYATHIPAHVVGAAAFILGDYGIDLGEVNRFMLGLCGGNLTHKDPRMSLRRIGRAYAVQRDEHPDYEFLAYTLRTWNLYAAGERVDTVSWKVDDGMPRIGMPR